MRKLILTEEQIRHIISEEMGVSKEVIELTDTILKEISNRMDNGVTEEIFNVQTESSNVTIDYMFLNFNSMDDYEKWYFSTKRTDGYDYDSNTIRLTVVMIYGFLDYSSLKSTIQHECCHYWQCKNKGGTISTNRYQAVVNGIFDQSKIVSNLCQILYCSNKNEINAFVNELYASAQIKNKEYSDYKEFIKDNTSGSNVFDVLKKSHNTIQRYLSNGTLLYGVSELINRGIIKNSYNFQSAVDYLLNISASAYKRLIREIGRVYSLHQEIIRKDNARKKEIIFNNKVK